MKLPIWLYAAAVTLVSVGLYLFISLCDAALAARLGGRPLPLLTQAVIDFRFALLAAIPVWIAWSIYLHRASGDLAQRFHVFAATSFLFTSFVICASLISLPIPFISLLPFSG